MHDSDQTHPWDEELRDAIADEIAEGAGLVPGGKLTDALKGLLGIFGCTAATYEAGRRRLVRELNREPLNAAAFKWLPDDWKSDNRLHVLSLAQWCGFETDFLPEFWTLQDEMCEYLYDLESWNPAYVCAFLQNYEFPENSDTEVSLSARQIKNASDASVAGRMIVYELTEAVRLQDPIEVGDILDQSLAIMKGSSGTGGSAPEKSQRVESTADSHAPNPGSRNRLRLR